MTQRSTLDHFAHCCAEAADGVALAQCGLAFYAGFGIDTVSYHGDSNEATSVRFDRDGAEGDGSGWRSQVLDPDALRLSPVENLARRRMAPFFWSEVASLVRLTKEERAYLRLLHERHPNDGLSIHVHGPQGAAAVVSLGFGPDAPRLSKTDLFTLQSAAQIAHLRFSAILESSAPQNASLSPREVEVLEWIATGKSNGVIAEILGISPHTVDTVVRRIFAKLEVNDRTTAAIRGLGAGLLRKPGQNGS